MGEGMKQPIWERWLAAEARARWWLTQATWRGRGFRRRKRSPLLTKCEVNNGDSLVHADVSTIIHPSHHKYTAFLLRTVSSESGALLCFSRMASHMRFARQIARYWFGLKNTGANKLSLACKCLAMKQMAPYGGVACSRYSVANRGSHPNTPRNTSWSM